MLDRYKCAKLGLSLLQASTNKDTQRYTDIVTHSLTRPKDQLSEREEKKCVFSVIFLNLLFKVLNHLFKLNSKFHNYFALISIQGGKRMKFHTICNVFATNVTRAE